MSGRLRRGMLLGTLLVAPLLLRLPFFSDSIFHCDSFGYCMGGLYQFISHPPGFVGYCVLGWLVNQAVGNIHHAFVLISLSAAALATWLVFGLAEEFGLDRRAAILATAVFAFSVCTLYFGMVVLSYAVEGAAATAFGFLAWRGLKSESGRPLFGATIVWALAGAFRATTSAFLLPLWLGMLWSARRKTKVWMHVLLATLLVVPWMAANWYLLEAKSGFRSTASRGFWDLQVMMPIQYQTDALGIRPSAEETPAHHWPFVEVLVKGLVATGLVDQIQPAPSMGRAARLAGVQVVKWAFYLLVSVPALGVAVAKLIWGRNWPLDQKETLFVSLWVLPPTLFFWFGHLGSFGYLQVMLAPVAVCVGKALEGPIRGQSRGADSRWEATGWASIAAGVVFFGLAGPSRGVSETARLADVVILQYTGTAVRQEYAVARSTIWKEDPRQLPFVREDCNTDACLLAVAARIDWMPYSVLRRPVRRSLPAPWIGTGESLGR